MLEVLRTNVSGPREPVELAEKRLEMFRLLLLIASFLIPALGVLYEIVGLNITDPLWLRVMIGAFPFAVYVLSFKSRWVQEHFVRLYYTAIYLIMAWFVVISILNGFSSFYAICLMFVYLALGLGHLVGLYVMRPLLLFLVLGFCAIAFAIYIVPNPTVEPYNYMALIMSTGVLLYVTQRERFESRQALIESEARNRAVLEQTSEGVVLVDYHTLAILDANPGFCALAGYSEAELMRKSFTDILYQNDQTISPLWEDKKERLSQFIEEVRLRNRDDEVLPVECAVSRIHYSRQRALCIVTRDISKYKESEAALRRANEKTQELLRAKTTLLNNVSHELRTPLAGVMGFAKILTEETEGQHQEFAELIHKEGERLQETLDSVINLAQQEGGMAGNLKLQIRDLVKEVDEGLVVLQSLASKKNLSLDLKANSESVYANVHPVSFQRILSNLVTNAIKFTEDGGIEVVIEENGQYGYVHVRDTGIGIGDSFMPHLFEPFTQESDGLARAYDGVGLGLSICKHLVQQMDGKITVTSRQGEGSKFSVALPRVN